MVLRLASLDGDLLRLLVDAVLDYAIFALDADGNVVTWNPGAERIKGWSRGEIIGRHFSTFYPPEDVAAGKPADELERARVEGRVHDEGWRLRKDGSRFWAEVVITPLHGASGELAGFAKVTHDLTERRSTEESERAGALVEQRMRLGRRLLEGAVRDLFGVGLSLQALATEADPEVQVRLLRAVEDVDRVIEELRRDFLGS